MKEKKEFDRELFQYDDGGTIALDWLYSKPRK